MTETVFPALYFLVTALMVWAVGLRLSRERPILRFVRGWFGIDHVLEIVARETLSRRFNRRGNGPLIQPALPAVKQQTHVYKALICVGVIGAFATAHFLP